VIDEGLDVVVEGEAVAVGDPARLQQVDDSFAAKSLLREVAKVLYADLRDGTSIAEDGTNLLYGLGILIVIAPSSAPGLTPPM
jgi:hypothetical protein